MRFALTKQSSIKAVQFTVNSLAYSAQPLNSRPVSTATKVQCSWNKHNYKTEISPSETVSSLLMSELIRLYISDIMQHCTSHAYRTLVHQYVPKHPYVCTTLNLYVQHVYYIITMYTECITLYRQSTYYKLPCAAWQQPPTLTLWGIETLSMHFSICNCILKFTQIQGKWNCFLSQNDSNFVEIRSLTNYQTFWKLYYCLNIPTQSTSSLHHANDAR